METADFEKNFFYFQQNKKEKYQKNRHKKTHLWKKEKISYPEASQAVFPLKKEKTAFKHTIYYSMEKCELQGFPLPFS